MAFRFMFTQMLERRQNNWKKFSNATLHCIQLHPDQIIPSSKMKESVNKQSLNDNIVKDLYWSALQSYCCVWYYCKGHGLMAPEGKTSALGTVVIRRKSYPIPSNMNVGSLPNCLPFQTTHLQLVYIIIQFHKVCDI